MNTSHHGLDIDDIIRRHDLAHLQARELRRQAHVDFWRGTERLVATAATRARRSADRFLQSLRRPAPARADGRLADACPGR